MVLDVNKQKRFIETSKFRAQEQTSNINGEISEIIQDFVYEYMGYDINIYVDDFFLIKRRISGWNFCQYLEPHQPRELRLYKKISRPTCTQYIKAAF